MSDDLMPTGRARGRARGRGLNTEMGELSLLGRGRGTVFLQEKKEGKGRGEPSSTTTSVAGSEESSNLSSLSSLPASSNSSEGRIEPLGRGGTRGIRKRPESQMALWTRPENLNKKQGAGGGNIDLLTNYFSLVQKPDWSLYQYAVTFKPDPEDSRVSQLVPILSNSNSSQKRNSSI